MHEGQRLSLWADTDKAYKRTPSAYLPSRPLSLHPCIEGGAGQPPEGFFERCLTFLGQEWETFTSE